MRALIGTDLTGVLEDPWPLKRRWLRDRGYDFGPTPMSRGAVRKALGAQATIYEEMIADVYSNDQIPLHQPIPGALATITTLSSVARFIVLTSRMPERSAATTTWLATHGFLPYTGPPVMLGDPLYFPDDDHKPGSKLEWCVTRGAVALIDDALRNLEPDKLVPRSEAVVKFLFGDYIRDRPPLPSTTPVSDWSDLHGHLARLVRNCDHP